MRGARSILAASRSIRDVSRVRNLDSLSNKAPIGRRAVQISATPSTENGDINATNTVDTAISDSYGVQSPDARFEVLGAPYSVLSVTLSASQNLYTRRGTLIGVGGKAEHVNSTLSVLEPIRRSVLGIPFLYQKIISTSPVTALISTKSPITSFAVAQLDGTVDWMVVQRRALLAWTGQSLNIRPTINRKMSLAHWGNTLVTGRGLLALAGKGQVYQLALKKGESYIAHPSNVVAYTVTPNPPLPYRLKATILRMEIPNLNLSRFIPDTRFFKAMRESDTWHGAKRLYYTLRTWSRRTIWGDRLFLQFHGPTTILLQTRASRIGDVLTTRDVDEMAETEPGAIAKIVTLSTPETPATSSKKGSQASQAVDKPVGYHIANVGREGKVTIEKADDFSSIKKE